MNGRRKRGNEGRKDGRKEGREGRREIEIAMNVYESSRMKIQ